MHIQNPEQYEDKRVLVVFKKGNEIEEIEGQVISVKAEVILVRPRGRADFKLIEADDIERLQIVEVKPRELKHKELKAVSPDNVRQHLLDRHGWALKSINEMDDTTARKMHDDINHKLHGHLHVEKSEED